ncbi:MAG: NADH:flavin oxidoreductase, partial [Candidatus Lokiarchaeota archaeon]|nr:NADH:flavin oxidoreductase [Candidatus Lokiarchaeota archaeon]
MKLKNLFSPAKIGNVQIKNRIIRSATTERLANKEGTINDKYIKNYTDLAEGGIGLIISGFINVELG